MVYDKNVQTYVAIGDFFNQHNNITYWQILW